MQTFFRSLRLWWIIRRIKVREEDIEDLRAALRTVAPFKDGSFDALLSCIADLRRRNEEDDRLLQRLGA